LTQLSALQDLRLTAVRHFNLMQAQERLISGTLNCCLKSSNNSAHPATFQQAHSAPATLPPAVPVPFAATDLSAITEYTRAPTFTSPAKVTMTKYQPTPTNPEYPTDPLTNFQSPHARGFPGCLGCGGPIHAFKACPKNSDFSARANFYKNLFAHKPHLQKRPPGPSKMFPACAPSESGCLPPTQSFVAPAPAPSLARPSLPVPPHPAPPPSLVLLPLSAPAPPRAPKRKGHFLVIGVSRVFVRVSFRRHKCTWGSRVPVPVISVSPRGCHISPHVVYSSDLFLCLECITLKYEKVKHVQILTQ
jgi:hypothetical protein